MSKQLICKNLLVNYAESAKKDFVATIIFLHGWRSDKKIWTRVVKSGKLSSYQVYSIDLPGFGGSQIPSQPMTVGGYADVAAEFIKKLDLKNVIIVGHSFGGRVGIKLAATHPELISKLILVDSAGFAMNRDKKSLMRAVAKILKPFFRPDFMQRLRKWIYKQIGAEDYLATPELQKTFVNVTTEDLSEDMQKIVCPTLIVNGENDKDTPVEFGKRMQSIISNSKLQILSDAGHFCFIDQPEEFAVLVSDFIKP